MAANSFAYDGETRITLNGAVFPNAGLAQIAEVRWRTGVNRVSTMDILLRAEDYGDLPSRDALGTTARVELGPAPGLEEPVPFWFTGLVAAIDRRPAVSAGPTECRVTLVSNMALLGLSSGVQVYTETTVPDVLTETLVRNGLSAGGDFELRLSGDYPALPVIMQYNESDLVFVLRLCERWGISVFDVQQPTGGLLVFTDDNAAMGDGGVLDMAYDFSGSCDGLHELSHRWDLASGRVGLCHYNPDQADLGWVVGASVAGGQSGERTEVATAFPDVATGDRLAHVRAEALAAETSVYRGIAGGWNPRNGQIIRLTGHPDWADLELLVISVDAVLAGATHGSAGSQVARPRVEFLAVPEAQRYRPPARTPWPVISGVLHGLIEPHGQDGIHIDKDGAYRVRLLIDQTRAGGKPVPFPSVRMAQALAGPGYGQHLPLHPGTEVLVGFTDGDPDRPVILGAVPNPSLTSPVTSANPSQSILRTAAGNEINVDDSRDGQSVSLTSPGSRTGLRLGLAGTTGNPDGAALTTEGSVTVGADLNGAVTCGDRLTLKAANQISLEVGGNTVVITGDAITLTVGNNTIQMTRDSIALSESGDCSITLEDDISLKTGDNIYLTAAEVKHNEG